MAGVRRRSLQLFYLFNLRSLPIGNWTMPQRKEYFSYYLKSHKRPPHDSQLHGAVDWFAAAGRPYADGNSFELFLRNFFKEATANLSDAERKQLASLLESIDKASVTTYDVPPRPVVKEWKMEDIQPLLAKVDKGRSFKKGQEAYLAGQCIKCHHFGNEGGGAGPDLTAVSSRFSRRDILESILEPSKVVSDQYVNEVINTKSGKTVVGRIMDDSPDKLVVQPNPLSPGWLTILGRKWTCRIARAVEELSPMPDHLVDGLTAEEILDLDRVPGIGGTQPV